MLRIAIVEDEKSNANRLQGFCERYSAESGEKLFTQIYGNGISFLEKYCGEVDAVLMDIAMPHMDGMTCARLLRERDETVPLIFVTNMAQYAIRGYEVGALDFMVKPVEYEEFVLKMDKLRRISSQRNDATILVPQRDQAVVLKVRDITYVEIYNHYLLFHTRSKVLETYGKLSALEADRRFSGFVRCSQSHFVNCAYISAIGRESLTVNGEEIPLARRKRRACMEQIAGLLGRGEF